MRWFRLGGQGAGVCPMGRGFDVEKGRGGFETRLCWRIVRGAVELESASLSDCAVPPARSTPRASRAWPSGRTSSTGGSRSTRSSKTWSGLSMRGARRCGSRGTQLWGCAISGIADRIPEPIAQVVHLDAVVLDGGTHAVSVYPPPRPKPGPVRPSRPRMVSRFRLRPSPLPDVWGLCSAGEPDHDWWCGGCHHTRRGPTRPP